MVYDTTRNDPGFAEAFNEIRNAYLDYLGHISIDVVRQLLRNGFNDNKLHLQAHRPEIFNDKIQVNINQNVTHKIRTSTIHQILNLFSI